MTTLAVAAFASICAASSTAGAADATTVAPARQASHHVTAVDASGAALRRIVAAVERLDDPYFPVGDARKMTCLRPVARIAKPGRRWATFWLAARYEYGTPGYDRCASAGNGAMLLRRHGHAWTKKAVVGSDPDALCLAQRESGAPRAVVEALAGWKGGCR